MQAYFLTDTGLVRNHNEDAGGVFRNKGDQLLAVIADGMGGHNAGDVASEIATTTIQEKWEKTDFFTTPDEAETWLMETVIEINTSIYQYAQTNEAYQGMGTTIVAAICLDDFVSVANIGDSRCYLSNEQGFKQLTEDHSLVNELFRSGQISKEDAEHHPRKNVLLKALGTEPSIQPDISSIGWEESNTLLLCSDGLSNKFNEPELAETITQFDQLEEIGKQLISVAKGRGGEDNISIALVTYDVSKEEGDA
ncbi:Stp1/IreP family PP2C-type Ser/Thr phosphatase [Aquibacillus sp. 3ASR75-11]|uniref:protein-serine/threonine phosphatase n=1 Tax=Terrihalobacillus insolitus TaxID=2950438 RepID=A0A9X4ALC2_9BACI|nr:Stp1/IreP family PP2C-type Ser/Thr phosphatase [Terrihalobacillus insolitus]MDC3423624.1 Stp1/IreP family PP2C-type Ser/Thr phosphatase [Terrihalobacillus insolitus]